MSSFGGDGGYGDSNRNFGFSSGPSSKSSNTGGSAVDDYFKSEADKIPPPPEPKEIYKAVVCSSASSLMTETNKFLHENPNYEISDDKFYMRTDYLYAIFKLKEPEIVIEKSKTEVKD